MKNKLKQSISILSLSLLLGLSATAFSQTNEPRPVVTLAVIPTNIEEQETIAVELQSPMPETQLDDQNQVKIQAQPFFTINPQTETEEETISIEFITPSPEPFEDIESHTQMPVFSTSLQIPPPFIEDVPLPAETMSPPHNEALLDELHILETTPVIEAAKASFTMIEEQAPAADMTVAVDSENLNMEVLATETLTDNDLAPDTQDPADQDEGIPDQIAVAVIQIDDLSPAEVLLSNETDEGRNDEPTEMTPVEMRMLESAAVADPKSMPSKEDSSDQLPQEVALSAKTDTAENLAPIIEPPSPKPLPIIDALLPWTDQLEYITLNNIFFTHDKAILSIREKKKLDDIAEYLNNTDSVSRLIIDGHANSIASRDYNYRLSNKRANAVKKYLVKQGVDKGLLTIKAWGENFPVDQNWTRAGSQRNRHVELYLIQHAPKIETETAELIHTVIFQFNQ